MKEILNKDALFVDFDDNRSNVVKLHGVSMATEKEMLDEQIFEFLHSEIRGKRVRVNPVRVDTGDILVSEVYSMADEYLNAILIRQGFGRWNPSEAANDKRMSDAQETAQIHLQGVWNPAVQTLMADDHREDHLEEEDANSEDEDLESSGASEPKAKESSETPEPESEPVASARPESEGNSDFKPGLV